MQKVTAVIIAKNEEERIAACIDSVSFCDEIFVIDNKSTDDTYAASRKKGANVFSYASSDFSDARNFALKQVKTEWVLYIDADERVSNSLRETIKNEISHTKSNFSAYRVKRKNFYLGNNEWPKVELLERLFQTEKLTQWQGKLHESPVVEGDIGELDGYLHHYTHRSLSEMVEKTLEWSKIEAQLRLQNNHPSVSWWRFPRVMMTAFFDSYIKQGGWKVGTVGVIESIYQAFSMFITYVRLWEMQKKVKNQNAKVKNTTQN